MGKVNVSQTTPTVTRVPIFKRGDVTLRVGDRFRVEGRHARRYRFVAYVIGKERDDGTRDTHIECVEIRGGRERAGIRAVRPETVRRDK